MALSSAPAADVVLIGNTDVPVSCFCTCRPSAGAGEAVLEPASTRAAGSGAAGAWQDDRESAEPFDPAEVVWAPTPRIRDKMLNMRKKARTLW